MGSMAYVIRIDNHFPFNKPLDKPFNRGNTKVIAAWGI
jgi:hypothetical protein